MLSGSNDTPHVPKVGLTTFAAYLTASSGKRIDCIRDQIRTRSRDFRPGPAFYQDMIDAMKRGRSSGADELAMQRVIAAQSDGPRRDHYTQLADHWLALRELRLPLVAFGSATWRAPSLSVSIRPEFAVRDAAGNVLVIKLWLKDDPLLADAVKSCLWLLNNQMDSLVPGATPVVADIRRQKIHRIGRRRYSRDFAAYLESEAEGMAVLWRRLAA